MAALGPLTDRIHEAVSTTYLVLCWLQFDFFVRRINVMQEQKVEQLLEEAVEVASSANFSLPAQAEQETLDLQATRAKLRYRIHQLEKV